jgi:predicted ATPase
VAADQDTAAILRFGSFALDRAGRTLSRVPSGSRPPVSPSGWAGGLERNGETLVLGARAFDVLQALVERRGELVTKEQLLERAWPGLVVEEANVHVQVSQLRKLLGADAIATVSGLGYRFALPVTAAGPAAPWHNLPAERSAFVGRQVALEDMQSRLKSTRLLTLIGIGGAGKTRLARKLAERQLGRFADGVWWVDLASIDRAEQIAPAAAQVLGCRLDAAGAPIDLLAAQLRDRELLLVLDNCEHLVDAVAALVDRLLGEVADLRIVITSREALGIAGEVAYQVKPLELPDPDASAARALQSDAVRLFVQCASQAHEAFALEERNVSTVAEICRQVDGIPLALELAASQLRVIAPQQLLEMLRQRFRLMLGSRRALPRQQTLHAVIRWSFDNLRDDERELLLAVSVCAGSCDLDAVRVLTGPDADPAGLIAGLSRLTELSLLTVRHEFGVARYRLLETVRQFAADLLQAEGAAAGLHDRHRDHYTQLAEAACDQLGDDRRDAALQRLDLERDNIARALDWAVTGRQWTIGARLVRAQLRFWIARGLVAAGFEQASAVLAMADSQGPAQTLARLELDAAELALRIGRLGDARSLALAAMSRAQRAQAAHLEFGAMILRAQCDMREDQQQRAQADLMLALERARAEGLREQESRVLSALGDVHTRIGDLAAARDCFAAAMTIDDHQGNREDQLTEMLNLAFIAVRAGEPTEARRLATAVSRQLLATPHHFHECALVDVCACLAGLELDWRASMRWHLAATRHFAEGGYVESPERRRRRESDLHQARAALAPAEQEDIARQAEVATLVQELERVRDWLGLVRPDGLCDGLPQE